MGLGKMHAFLMGVFGGAVSGAGATTGQALVKQANGSWAPGTVSGGSAAQFIATDDGSAAAPAFRGSDANTGIYFPATDAMALVANNAVKMYIDDTLGVQGLGVQLSGYKKVQINQTGDATLSASDPDIVHTNIGASGAVNLTLPSSPSGVSGNSCIYHAVVGVNQYLRFTATTGVTIRDGATVSATAGYIRSTTVGSTITLLGISATEWVVFSKIGTWTIDS